MLGSNGGAMLQDILRTATQPEEVIVSFQKQYGLKENTTSASLQLLDLLGCRRSETHSKLLDTMVATLLKRIHSKQMTETQLQKLLELTFPYLEMRELRAIPIAVLSTQTSTPASFLHELCDHDNRSLLEHLPVHVKRRIWAIAPHELRLEVDKIVGAYIKHKLDALLLTSADDPSPYSLYVSSSSHGHHHHHHLPSPEDRRKQDPVLATFVSMIGDSSELYLQCVDILRTIAAAGSIPGHDAPSSSANSKDYVYLASLIGSLRNDIANVQRDLATPLVRTDPLHKFIWILDHAVKRRDAMDRSNVTELLMTVRRLRLRDLPRKDLAANDPPPMIPKETLLKLVDQLAKADSRRIFADPVPTDVEGYHDVIKYPMDISTLRHNVHQLKYRTLAAFAADMRLIFTNCTTYNPDTTIYHKEAKRLDKLSAGWIDKAAAAAAQAGMVFEGECDPLLADIVLVLSDPIVKALLFDVLWQTLHRTPSGSFPTDDPMVRGVVQLLQLGNVGSLRRMVRKQEYVLRSPPVLSLRVALPLYCRYRLLHQHPTLLSTNASSIDDGGWKVLWANGGSHLKSVVRQIIVVAIHDHWPLAFVKAIVTSMGDHVDDAFVKDPVFLHTLTHAILHSKHKSMLIPLVLDSIWLPAALRGARVVAADDVPVVSDETVSAGLFPLEPMHVAAARLLAHWTTDLDRVTQTATKLLSSLTSESMDLAAVWYNAAWFQRRLRPLYEQVQAACPSIGPQAASSTCPNPTKTASPTSHPHESSPALVDPGVDDKASPTHNGALLPVVKN
ncbi:hypothetical protein DYB32_005955 [Aphanomyces invadans]|uniref:Bromo domain-containing protein n=1 Tax=Aphanomyces invadans TaxID=157072 RepID=A0A3R6VVN6_9STRA|nr:hypothetical protein DYB32_005955 [Aphanomyces invadans]